MTDYSHDLPPDNVATLGWRFVTFKRKVACQRCHQQRYIGVVGLDANERSSDVKMVCRACFKDLDNGPREGMDF
jgi:hypothetical protein